MRKGRLSLRHNNRPSCGCSDPACPACHGTHFETDYVPGSVYYRADMDCEVTFCDACADDAIDSGLFVPESESVTAARNADPTEPDTEPHQGTVLP